MLLLTKRSASNMIFMDPKEKIYRQQDLAKLIPHVNLPEMHFGKYFLIMFVTVALFYQNIEHNIT